MQLNFCIWIQISLDGHWAFTYLFDHLLIRLSSKFYYYFIAKTLLLNDWNRVIELSLPTEYLKRMNFNQNIIISWQSFEAIFTRCHTHERFRRRFLAPNRISYDYVPTYMAYAWQRLHPSFGISSAFWWMGITFGIYMPKGARTYL